MASVFSVEKAQIPALRLKFWSVLRPVQMVSIQNLKPDLLLTTRSGRL